jgi:hypothetical protein
MSLEPAESDPERTSTHAAERNLRGAMALL